ncbi:transcription elongation factor GreA [candidate division WWE3 bacterium CG08_land_8_20_14_0_20_40_13]|uniref:Transcription elongation factor GreA n=1 Tax=candidate division WWE3 bacterium CG08_land_8_20_14_0_20_40_13 TaxID=1975084 RepID=A0A2H0XEV0_UNCKA|nr:MAG: transcription elongation factor GreA [candidate division WWE3 bacterium CG08_land_8_20_14_0_20_40_13]
MDKVILTKEGLEKLKAEYDELVNIRRKDIVDRIAKAREQGDLSENGAYHAAKEEQAFIEGRIEELEDILKNALVEVSTGTKDGIIKVGCVVRVKIDSTEEEFSIVGTPEANPTEKKISHESPLGAALLGKKVGDVVEVEAPVGKIHYEILGVR